MKCSNVTACYASSLRPDIGLACPLSRVWLDLRAQHSTPARLAVGPLARSKAHAIVLQNWMGKIFLKDQLRTGVLIAAKCLQDLGSAHGTFLSGVRLNPHEPQSEFTVDSSSQQPSHPSQAF